MHPLKLIYHPGYDLQLGSHVFPSVKFRLIREYLIEQGHAKPDDFLQPEPALESDLLLVHTADWVHRLRDGTLREAELMRLELPWSRALVEGFWLAAGGSILAARMALAQGGSYNVGGGFHHAFPAHGEGFCAIHDVAVAIRRLQHDGQIKRAMVVDCDVHHGNGTAAIFANDPSVFTFSIHQFHNYPAQKPPSTVDLHLEDGVGDDEYLQKLREQLEPSIADFKPELIFYIAGADPYREDQLGGLDLTFDGLRKRDELVLGLARRQGIPFAVTLAGGYALDVRDTVRIQATTAIVAAEVLRPAVGLT
jgi:acetoin utilization deacetylase AcuC-like enzyme